MRPAPERPDLTFEEARHKIVGWADCCAGEFNVSDAEDEASRAELDAVLRAIAAPVTDAGLREAAQGVVDAAGDDLYPGVSVEIAALRAALSRQAEKETA